MNELSTDFVKAIRYGGDTFLNWIYRQAHTRRGHTTQVIQVIQVVKVSAVQVDNAIGLRKDSQGRHDARDKT